MDYELTDDAVLMGMNAALPAVLELRGSIAESGRGERSRTAITDLSVRSRRLLCVVVGAEDWLERAG
jgi:hypothetical protein